MKFSEKTAKTTYKNHVISVTDVKRHDGRWYCTVYIETPLQAPHIDVKKHLVDFACSSDDEAIEMAKAHARQHIQD